MMKKNLKVAKTKFDALLRLLLKALATPKKAIQL